MLLLVVLLALLGVALAQIPSIQTSVPAKSRAAPFVFTPLVRIVVSARDAHTGSPSLLDFARTFRDDLASVSGWPVAQVQLGVEPSSLALVPTVYLSLGAKTNFTYLSGMSTGEGYEFDISRASYTIRATEALGAWWGTRTLLQQLVLARSTAKNTLAVSIPAASGRDVPSWEVRGAMLDVGRHFFTTSFLGELCTYASFFKISSLHLHASDNLWDPRFLYGVDWRKLYAAFRFQPAADSPLAGLVPQRNESWSRADFLALQATCTAHGVTLVPEVDTPGHSLVFTKWKPEMAIPGQPDNLNLSHPETIPTVQSVWREFLPWFTSNEVHIGADEYDRAFAGVYNEFINDMAAFIKSESGKGVRVWGTGMPPANSTISTDVTIQHWNFPDTVPVQLLEQGYRVINSEQAFLYTDGKTSYGGDQFPQELDADLFWRTNWAPNIFSASDPSNNTTPDHPGLRGSVMALWNDWGNNATTPLEIYFQLAQSLALLGERTWAGAGQLTRDEFDATYPLLSAAAPGQNLARRASVSGTVLRLPGRARLGNTGAKASSVGPPYTLSFTVSPRAAKGVLFSGPDTKLHLSNLTFEDVPTGTFYPLGVELPLNTSTRVEVHATRSETRAIIGGQTYFWETLLDMWGDYMQPANMSFVAPAASIGVEGFVGTISDVVLRAD
ncbi:glycoside hydrolase [Exidia glandulosa HHB12029]|uniref:beta-N-acetylhexosaminidase n=1 Tax=Exidia glandulosa HHB12029 TaxID=1314781 RepID=A0A165LJI1_EXIGL|nr:glycoside hydrolase [Exidia glandulosa HHB12029]